jgi:lysine 2,3-aminomutase
VNQKSSRASVPGFPFGASRYYQSLAQDPDSYQDPIARQFLPSPEEEKTYPYEDPDPISDRQYLVAPRLVHHYPSRVLLLTNDRCSTYCRHCFRRHFTANADGRLRGTELKEVCAYLSEHPEVQEILLSGGDPLMLPDQQLLEIIRSIKALRPELIIRLCTRIPVVLPDRVTEELVAALGAFPGLWLVTHINHPWEITQASTQALGLFAKRGIPLLNQAVLLRGVNDNLETLEELFLSCLRIGVKPYYLFQGDLASGTKHLRVNLEKGLALMEELKIRLSALALPLYAVDLPGGGGKTLLGPQSILRQDAHWYYLQDRQGQTYRYPIEHPQEKGL